MTSGRGYRAALIISVTEKRDVPLGKRRTEAPLGASESVADEALASPIVRGNHVVQVT